MLKEFNNKEHNYMEFPDYDARLFRIGLHKLFPKDGKIDLDASAAWLQISTRTLRNWIKGNAPAHHTTWCLVYLCSSGDLALFHPQWYGWHIFRDTIGTATRRYTAAQVESLEWFQTANARLITIAADFENEANALPMNKKTVQQEVESTRNIIAAALNELEQLLTTEQQQKQSISQRTA